MTLTLRTAIGPAGQAARVVQRRVTLGPPLRLAPTLRRGIALVAGCASTCTAGARAYISAATARSFRLRANGRLVEVGRGSARLPDGGTRPLRIAFTRAAKSRLRRARRLSLAITLRVEQPGGGARTVTKRLLLRK